MATIILAASMLIVSSLVVLFSEKCETELSNIEARFEYFIFLNERYKDWR